jgi:hypothetical protein
MPLWIAKRSARAAWKRIPWTMVWAISVWLAKKGRDRVEANLTKKERSELVNLVAKSKGKPANLAQRDRTRLKHIAGKAIRG